MSNYYEEYSEYPEPSSISYEQYTADINSKNSEIEELNDKIDELEAEIDDAQSIINNLKGELKRYERIFKKNNIAI